MFFQATNALDEKCKVKQALKDLQSVQTDQEVRSDPIHMDMKLGRSGDVTVVLFHRFSSLSVYDFSFFLLHGIPSVSMSKPKYD